MITVSNRIANSKFDDLKGLVEPSLIDKIKIGYEKLNQEQRNMLATNLNQVTHQRVIDFNVRKKDESTLVEIMIQFYILNNLEDIKNAFSENVNFKEHLTIHVKNLIIAEYRFARVFSHDSLPDWLITDLNHYNSEYYTKFIQKY